MKDRPTSEQLAVTLNTPHFGPSQVLTPSDPMTPTSMLRKLAELKPYDRNPRWAPNERYDEIKASVRVRGLETTLPITRRPGEELYMVAKGGNTRLRILTELYEETGEQQFYEVRCDFSPWVSESEVLLAHLTENDKRGKLFFIDRARGVRELQTLLEVEAGEKLALRQFSEQLSQLGYYQDIGTITRMNYALDVLLPAIPEALAAGMGRRHIDVIRRLDQAAGQLWQRLGIEDDFQAIWAALLNRYDGDRWDYDQFRAAVEKEIEVTADRDQFDVAQALSRLLKTENKAMSAEAVEEAIKDAAAKKTVSRIALPSGPSTGRRKSARAKEKPSPKSATGHKIGHDAASGVAANNDMQETNVLAEDNSQPGEASLHVIDAAAIDGIHTLVERHRDVSGDIKSMRTTAWTLASHLSRRNHLDGLIVHCDRGCGYLVTDVPDSKLVERLDGAGFEKVSALWWQLLACCEITAAPKVTVLPLLPETSTLRKAITDSDMNSLKTYLAPLDPSQFGTRLWRTIDDQGWGDLLQLIAIYRGLHQVAAGSGTALWGESS